MTSPRLHALIQRRLDDLQALVSGQQRRRYRQELLSILDSARQQWASNDYGAGYLYQSLPLLGLRGFRDTAARASQMGLGDELRGKSILEVGCNTGFLSLSLSRGTRRYLAFDNNPYLIDIARLSLAELKRSDIDFRTCSFEDLPIGETFDVALSLANHSTWDGNMTLALAQYFEKLHAMLAPSGVLLFESHHPALENHEQLQVTLSVLERFFKVEVQRVLTRGSPWDRGRTFIKARKLELPNLGAASRSTLQ